MSEWATVCEDMRWARDDMSHFWVNFWQLWTSCITAFWPPCILDIVVMRYNSAWTQRWFTFVCTHIYVNFTHNFMGFSYIIFLFIFKAHAPVEFLVFLPVCRTAYGLNVRSMWLSVTAIHEPDHRTSGSSCLKLARWRCPWCKARGESHGSATRPY